MAGDIQAGKFKAHFVVPEAIPTGTSEDARQDEAVKKRFGDKPLDQTD